MLLPSSIITPLSRTTTRPHHSTSTEHHFEQPPTIRDTTPQATRPHPHLPEFLHVKAPHRTQPPTPHHRLRFPQDHPPTHRIPPKELPQPHNPNTPRTHPYKPHPPQAASTPPTPRA